MLASESSTAFLLQNTILIICAWMHINMHTDLMNATIKEVDQKGKMCFEITPAPSNYASKKSSKSKDKNYVFYAENEQERERWAEALRRAVKYRPAAMAMEMGGDENGSNQGAGHHGNPMHAGGERGSESSTGTGTDTGTTHRRDKRQYAIHINLCNVRVPPFFVRQ